MIRGKGPSWRAVASGVALACAIALSSPVPAWAQAPHVSTGTMSDTCAMCHRAHTAMGDFGRVDTASWEMTGTALGIAVPSNAGDTLLCYSCHGVDALGSGTPIGAAFEEPSVHSLAPTPSPFGPSVKQCSSCHDSHGTDKNATGTTYARLLRSRDATGAMYFDAPAYCGSCHAERAESRFDGVAVYEQTAHYLKQPDPADGTKVRCLNCHVGHGSAIAPLVSDTITPPALEDTATVPANDRRLCFICHPDPLGLYPGQTDYEQSAHAVSSVTTTIPGEWADPGAERLVGECQVCHSPMGRDDGTGAPIPDMLEAESSALCARCHDADGPASTDLTALAYPATAAAHPELVVAFSPETTTSAFGTLAVWGTDAGQAPPRPFVGPRFYKPAGATGDLAIGDIDGAEGTDVVVADPAASRLTVFMQDPLKGLTSYYGPGVVDLPAGVTADFVAIGDVFDDPDVLPEVCIVDASTGQLYVLRWDILAADLVVVEGPLAVGASPTGLAVGDMVQSPFAEVFVTDAAAPQITVFRSSATPDTLIVERVLAGRPGVRAPSIGDVWRGRGGELVVANADDGAGTISVYQNNWTLVGTLAVNGPAGARPWDTLAANVLPGLSPAGTSGVELAVALNGGQGASAINVFGQTGVGGSLGTPQRYDTGTGSSSGALGAGDIDGDGQAELVVGNGGYWSRDAALAAPASVLVFQHTVGGAAFDTALTAVLEAGGVERAGAPPAVVVADVGGFGPSRHPAGAVADAHAAGESAPFARHVECADCHNVHETTSTVAAAPDVYGSLLGAFGVEVTHGTGGDVTFGEAQPVAYEYQVCLKCHSSYATAAGLEGALDVLAEVNANNASVHAVEGTSAVTAQADTFVAPWGSDSVLYCIDCHTSADEALDAVAGPHTSSEAPILKSPYLGVLPSNASLICYDCHKRTVYYAGTDDAGASASWFSDATAGPLHGLHVRDHGFGCASCHVSHGSPTNERLIRDAISFVVGPGSGTCIGPCHPSGVQYQR